jgi:hypothetical protein
MKHRRTLCAWLALLLLAQPLFADVVVLKSGEKYAGTVANRDQVRTDPRASRSIGILVTSSSELQRFAVDDVEYIILEDRDGDQVIDLLAAAPRTSPASVVVPARIHRGGDTAVLAVLGSVALGAGALVKFGGPKCSVTQSSVDCDKKSYNALNYTLMGFGGFLLLMAIVQGSSSTDYIPEQSSGDSTHPIIALRPGRNGPVITVGYRFSF